MCMLQDLAYGTPPLKDMSLALALFLPPYSPETPSSLGGLLIPGTGDSSSGDLPINSHSLIP